MAKDQRPRSELTDEENRARTEREVAEALDVDQLPSGVTGQDAKPSSAKLPGTRTADNVGRRGEIPGTGPLQDTDIQSSGFAERERLSEYMRRVHGRLPTPPEVINRSSVVTGNPLIQFWVERAVRIISPHQGPLNAKAVEMQWRSRLATPEGFAAFIRDVRRQWGFEK